MKFLTNINLNQNELQNAVLQNLAAAPASAVIGQAYFDTTLNSAQIFNGTNWVTTDARQATGIPNTALATNPLQRANHIGTQPASTISDLASTVQGYTLDTFADPVAPLNFNNEPITNLGAPVNPKDAATKGYVDTGDANTLALSQTYTDTATASAIASGIAYTNSVGASAVTTSENFATTQDAINLALAYNFATNAASGAQGSGEGYTDAQVAIGLAAAEAYTDARDTTINTAWAAGDVATLGSANNYTDAAKLAAINAAAIDATTKANTAQGLAQTYSDAQDVIQTGLLEAYSDSANAVTLASAVASATTIAHADAYSMDQTVLASAISTAQTTAAILANTGQQNAQTFATAGDVATLAAAEAFTLSQAANGSSGSNAYTDTQVASAILITESYANAQDALNLTAAENFATAADTTVLGSAKSYADTQDATNLAAANNFATAADLVILSSAAASAAAMDTVVLSTAESYADSEDVINLAAAKTYTDGQVASNLITAETFATNADSVVTSTVLASAFAADAANLLTAENRANHYGTQLSSTISDFDTAVQTNTLDSLTPPVANVNLNSKNIINLADPINPQDAATKYYVDNATQSAAAGIDSKVAVALVSVGNLATQSGLPIIDGVQTTAGMRVLLVGETDLTKNGPWIVSSGAWARPTDDGATGELALGAFWFVEQGTIYAASQWRLATPTSGTITPGTTAVTITQFGAAGVYSAQNGINLTGLIFSGTVAASGGLVVDVNGFAVDTTVVARKYSTNIGDGVSTSITVTHNLNTLDVVTSIRDAVSGSAVTTDWLPATPNTVVFNFSSSSVPSVNAYRVTIIG